MLKGIIDRLLADAPTIALVDDRIFPVVATQETERPYVTIRRQVVNPTIVKGQSSGWDTTFFIIAIVAERYQTCMEISAAIRTSIDDFTGTQSGITFDRVWYQASEDTIDKDDNSYVILDSYAAATKR